MAVERWFSKGETFGQLASESLEKKRYDIVCLFAQQAVELYIKGLLITLTGAKPYSHSLNVLAKGLEHSGISIPKKILTCIKSLSEHYLQARYPDARLDDYTIDEAMDAIKCMEVTLDFLREIRGKDKGV